MKGEQTRLFSSNYTWITLQMSSEKPSPNHILICCIHLDSACLNKNHVIEVGVRFFVHKVEKRAKFVALAFLEY